MTRKRISIDWSLIDTEQAAAEWEQARAKSKVCLANEGASLSDLGEGIGLIEFHTKANALNDNVCDLIIHACEEGGNRFSALVIGNYGKHFSAGADLAMILQSARAKKWADLEATIRNLQKATMSIKYCGIPVVAAPFSYALGGGCEICLHSHLVIAAKDTHMGLVEAGVGLVPAGGGTKELGLRALDSAEGQNGELLHGLESVLDRILAAKVSRDGEEARSLFLTPRDGVAQSSGPPLAIARRAALLSTAQNFLPAQPRTDIPILGGSGLLCLLEKLDDLLESNAITAHDALIGGRIARILCGGDGPSGTASEQQFLDLEREGFLYLLGTAATQQRIEYLLTHNTPLHN